MQIKDFTKKELDTRFDTYCIKIGVQLWCARQDLNLHAYAPEPKVYVTLVKDLELPECFIMTLQNTYQQSEFSGIN